MSHLSTRVLVSSLMLVVASANVRADTPPPRGFAPAPPSASQLVQTVSDVVVVSSTGKLAQVGTGFKRYSDKRAVLVVVVKNLGTEAIDFGTANISVTSDDKLMAVELPEASGKRGRDCTAERTNLYTMCMANANITSAMDKHGATTDCLGSSTTAYSNCLASVPKEASGISKIEPGQVFPSQYEVELPKKSSAAPIGLKVTVTIQGEAQSFQFWETD